MNNKIIVFVLVFLLLTISIKSFASKKEKNPMQKFPKTIGFDINNPTNINARNGGVYKGQVGERQTRDGLKRVFSSVEYGCLAASERIRDNYINRGINTIFKIAPIWTGGHNVNDWIVATERVSKIHRNKILYDSDLKMLVKGIIRAENSFTINDYYLRFIK